MKHTVLGLVIAALMGCASNPAPIIDTQGVDPELYARDMVDCEAYTDDVVIAAGTAKGTAAGVAVGAMTGAVNGDVNRGAALGGIFGGTRSALDADRTQQRVWKNCMRGRGYRVLN